MTARDSSGRFTGSEEMNRLIRRAAGRGAVAEVRDPAEEYTEAQRAMAEWRQHARDLAIVGREDEIPDPPYTAATMPPKPQPVDFDQGARVSPAVFDTPDMNALMRGDLNASRRTKGIDY